MAKIDDLKAVVEKGRVKQVSALVQESLDEGNTPVAVLNVMIDSMGVVGERFKNGEIFVPEMLVAAKAMKTGVEFLKPLLSSGEAGGRGKIILGTVAGDLHDIGKNLVAMMLKGAGFEIYDLDTDVDADTFIDKAEEVDADIICMSALLTTTMTYMQTVVDTLKEKKLRDKYIVMVGGAPVSEEFAKQVGADYYTPDAASAAEVARKLAENKRG